VAVVLQRLQHRTQVALDTLAVVVAVLRQVPEPVTQGLAVAAFLVAMAAAAVVLVR
jgi:hypothetical protein